MTRVDCVGEDLLKIMKESGCYLIYFDVESNTPVILNDLNKGQTTADTVKAFGICNRLGIRTGDIYDFSLHPLRYAYDAQGGGQAD